MNDESDRVSDDDFPRLMTMFPGIVVPVRDLAHYEKLIAEERRGWRDAFILAIVIPVGTVLLVLLLDRLSR